LANKKNWTDIINREIVIDDHISKKALLKNSQKNENYLLEGDLPVYNGKKYNDLCDGKPEDNVFEFSVGNLKCFLRMQVFSLGEEGNIQEE